MCKYQIGNQIIELKNLYDDQPVKRLVAFRTHAEPASVSYHIVYEEQLPLLQNENLLYYDNNLCVSIVDHIKFYHHIYHDVPYAVVEKRSNTSYFIHLLKDVHHHKLHHYFFPDLLHLEEILISKNEIVLHSSYIDYNGGAILFTTFSGGGKSTQAELWKTHKNAQIINGDKSILSKTSGHWKVHGLPFSGSSEHYLNKTLPLKAIVILNKGTVNHCSLVGIHGFRDVFSQVTVNPWDKSFCNTAMDLVIQLCTEVPVYYYSCTKTPDAVDVLYQEFTEKGIIDGII